MTKINIIFICNFFSIFSYYLRTQNASPDHVWRELSLHMQLFNYPLLIEEDCQLLDETIHLDLLINYLNIVLLCFSKHLPRKAEEIRGKNFFYFFFFILEVVQKFCPSYICLFMWRYWRLDRKTSPMILNMTGIVCVCQHPKKNQCTLGSFPFCKSPLC